MMGLVLSLRSSMTSLYSDIMVYIHAVVQWEETSVLSFAFVLSQTVHGGMLSTETTGQRSKCCAVKYLENIPSSCTGFSTALIFLACHIYAEKTGINRCRDAAQVEQKQR